MKSKAYILVGVPGAGKSTWVKNQNLNKDHTVFVSTDNHVEEYAEKMGKTYNAVFHEYMPIAVKLMTSDVVRAVQNRFDIVWDQTSTSIATRRKKFNMIPSKHYEMIAVVFRTPARDELNRRLASRPGKSIPEYVIENMIGSWQEPTIKEGFDVIIYP